ncbi:MAG: SDR family NAD(P)-dependent oxidoreductase, partial [Hyphomicrobiales bacterium]|nr:SDR family NAD(P)-dependent oxidoreductase [Hyphomicrobiales bacterium]
MAEAAAGLWAAEGAHLALVGRNADRLETIAADLRVSGAAAVEMQVADCASVDAVSTLEEIAKRLGALDVVLLAYGVLGDQFELERDPAATAEFLDNNVTATENVIVAAKAAGVANVVHISSSVVNSLARDYYTETKKAQEKLAVASCLQTIVLRPTLMFGWFDRKHLGWLARFMQRTPVFPVPGDGHYLRQPLYVGDFCDIIASCIETPRPGQAFNISGRETLSYIDLIHAVKEASKSSTRVVCIPYRLFWLLLRAYALVDKDLTDAALAMFDKMLGSVFRRADRAHKDNVVDRARTLDASARALLGMAKVMLAAKDTGEDQIAAVERAIGWERLKT